MPRSFCLLLLVCPLFLVGCGGVKLVPVSGVVTIDGKPVDGATVTFVSEDGKNSFSGSTDASGNFSLQSGEKVGAAPGNYKVVVVKSTHKPTDEAPDPSSAGSKMMKKENEDDAKATAAAKAKSGASSDPMAKMKGMMASGAQSSTSGGVKSELPTVYASASTTPITVKVPVENPPVKIELKSK